jgi:hypothetical protein
LFNTRSTVAMLTPAAAATSRAVGFLPILPSDPVTSLLQHQK